MTNGKTVEAPETTAPKTRQSSPMDSELRTMGRINRLMEEMNVNERRRVAAWIHDRWAVPQA